MHGLGLWWPMEWSVSVRARILAAFAIPVCSAGAVALSGRVGHGHQPVASCPRVDSQAGFRDLAIGQTCSRVPGFEATRGIGGLEGYRRQGDELVFGQGALSSIVYGCADDRLRAVVLTAPASSSSPIALELLARYGKPNHQEEGVALWQGSERAARMSRDRPSGELMLVVGDRAWVDEFRVSRSLAGGAVDGAKPR
jgi:hypothetical protein